MTKDKDKNDGITGEDRKLWDFVTRSIRPLDKLERKQTAAVPASRAEKPREPESFLAAWRIPSFGLKPVQEPLTQGGGGIDRRTADRLKRGELPIEGRLDLHGLRQAEAQDRLMQFLLQSYDAGRRCVLVITGKGNRFHPEQEAGILRRLLPVWVGLLPLAQIVLMHSKARPKDGGDGAFYILLRRRR